MEWFVLQPASIAALSEFMLSAVLTFYLISIKKKSRDTWLILTFVGTSTIYYFVAFLNFSTYTLIARNSLNWAHTITLTLFQLSALPFAYYFKKNSFPKESRMVMIAAPLLAVILLIYQRSTTRVIFLYFLFLNIWFTIVFIRKAIIARKAVRNDRAVEAIPLNKKPQNEGISRSQRTGFLEITANRQVKGFMSFAYWGMLVTIIWINVDLMSMNVIPQQVWNPVHNTLILITIVWLIINYINHANELTTFLVKLVGLSLCAVLLLLGVMGFLLNHYQGVTLPTPDTTYTLRILAVLILVSTAVILIVFPLFFKRNLLRPIGKVLAGVQRVNAGNLHEQVLVDVNDEVGNLAQQFNVMTASLRKYAEEMEFLVAERTQELNQSLKDLKATQSQLIQREKMASLGELTAGIAHEIQNPLNFVNNFSEVNNELIDEMKEELSSGKANEALTVANAVKENNIKINQHGKRAEAIVKNMLQHSRSSTGRKEPTDVNALAEEYVQLAYHGFRAKEKSFNAVIETHLDNSIGKINIIPQDMGRVFLNLFNNAFYATSEKKKKLHDTYEPVIWVSTKKEKDKVIITVNDNGTGIPQKVMDKVFQPFFTTKPTGQGTGLGLSLSYDIIKAHGGEIKVESKEGEETAFMIQIPI